MISPGETKTLIFVKWNAESRILQSRLDGIKISVCYESLLGDHWEVTDGIPKEVDKPCEILMEQEFGF